MEESPVSDDVERMLDKHLSGAGSRSLMSEGTGEEEPTGTDTPPANDPMLALVERVANESEASRVAVSHSYVALGIIVVLLVVLVLQMAFRRRQ